MTMMTLTSIELQEFWFYFSKLLALYFLRNTYYVFEIEKLLHKKTSSDIGYAGLKALEEYTRKNMFLFFTHPTKASRLRTLLDNTSTND